MSAQLAGAGSLSVTHEPTQPRSLVHQLSDERRESTQHARIPLIGVDSGAIPGTKPGCSAAALERAGREIVRSRMALARKRLATSGK